MCGRLVELICRFRGGNIVFLQVRGGNIVEGCCIVLTRVYKIAVMDLSPPPLKKIKQLRSQNFQECWPSHSLDLSSSVAINYYYYHIKIFLAYRFAC